MGPITTAPTINNLRDRLERLLAQSIAFHNVIASMPSLEHSVSSLCKSSTQNSQNPKSFRAWKLPTTKPKTVVTGTHPFYCSHNRETSSLPGAKAFIETISHVSNDRLAEVRRNDQVSLVVPRLVTQTSLQELDVLAFSVGTNTW